MTRRLANAAERHGGGRAEEGARGENARFNARKSILDGVSTSVTFRAERIPMTGDSIPRVMLSGGIKEYRRLTKSVKSIFSASPASLVSAASTDSQLHQDRPCPDRSSKAVTIH